MGVGSGKAMRFRRIIEPVGEDAVRLFYKYVMLPHAKKDEEQRIKLRLTCNHLSLRKNATHPKSESWKCVDCGQVFECKGDKNLG